MRHRRRIDPSRLKRRVNSRGSATFLARMVAPRDDLRWMLTRVRPPSASRSTHALDDMRLTTPRLALVPNDNRLRRAEATLNLYWIGCRSWQNGRRPRRALTAFYRGTAYVEACRYAIVREAR